MENNLGWVKLHRQLLKNQFLKRDHSAFIVFVYLLLLTHRDGVVTTGRFLLAEATGIKPNTLYKVLKRLEKAKMITQVSNNRFTLISILNWDKYQGAGNNDGKNQVKTKEKPNNTYTRIENKELRNRSNVEVQRTFDLFIKLFGKNENQYKLTTTRKTKLQSRINDAGEDTLARAIKNTGASAFHRGDNDRGWEADLDWIIKSYEQVEKLANMKSAGLLSSDGKKFNTQGDLARYEEYIKQQKELR